MELATVLQSHAAAWKGGRYANGRTLLDVYPRLSDRGRSDSADCRGYCPNHTKVDSLHFIHQIGHALYMASACSGDRFGSESRLVTFFHLPHPKKRMARSGREVVQQSRCCRIDTGVRDSAGYGMCTARASRDSCRADVLHTNGRSVRASRHGRFAFLLQRIADEFSCLSGIVNTVQPFQPSYCSRAACGG